MDRMTERNRIRYESRKRMAGLKFGDTVTNICAGEKNPMRVCRFVRFKPIAHHATCTDGNGKFCDFGADVIWPGEIPYEQAKAIYRPVCYAEFGEHDVGAVLKAMHRSTA